MSEASDQAIEAKEKDRRAALIIAILALLLALAEAGAKQAQHLSIEQNIESSDLFNFYQAKKIRSTVIETAARIVEAQKAGAPPEAQGAMQAVLADLNASAARLDKDPTKPEDSLDAIRERANAAVESRELANRRLHHYELGSGLAQIAIVLASAAIVTEVSLLIWFSVALGAIGAALLAFGFFAPAILPLAG
jgi:hypothetical protein